jgi:microcystin-dependent protein
MSFYKWSQTASSNATADGSVNWAEGQAPSSINDSARAMMAAAAKYRDDISGAIETAGTSTAYTVASYQSFASLATMSGKVIAFTPHTTNGATVTLNVDGLGAKPLRSAPSVELPAGTLIEGTPYTAVYNNSDEAWYLHGFYGNPYGIPIGGLLPFTGTTSPNSSLVFPYGQAISRSTYDDLFTLVGTTYGTGDGSSTFNVPDLRGRVLAGKDDMGGTSANRLTAADDGLNGDTLGATGGGETQTLVRANLPNTSVTVDIASGQGSHNHNSPDGGVAFVGDTGTFADAATGGANHFYPIGAGLLQAATLPAMTGTFNLNGNVTQTAFGIVQPTIITTFLLRVI